MITLYNYQVRYITKQTWTTGLESNDRIYLTKGKFLCLLYAIKT